MSYNASAMIFKAKLHVRKRRHKHLTGSVSLDVFTTKEDAVKKVEV